MFTVGWGTFTPYPCLIREKDKGAGKDYRVNVLGTKIVPRVYKIVTPFPQQLIVRLAV